MYQLLFRKRWSNLLLMFLSLVIVTGCHEEDPPTIEVSHNLIEVGSERSSTLISVVTNSEWTAVSDADWCRLSRTSGRFSSDIDVVVDESTSEAKRSAVITLTTRGRNAATVTILVSQSAEFCSLAITPGQVTVGNVGETVAFAVAASPSIEYTVSSSADWAVPAVKNGKGNGTIKVTVAENISHSIERTAVVTLSMKNDSQVVLAQFTVNQLSRRMAVIHLGQEALSFKQDAVTLKEHSYLIPVISNITGTIHVTSEFNWVKGEIQEINGARFVKVTTLSNNETNEARDCVLTIVGDVEGEAVTAQVKVSQAGLGSPMVTLFREIISVDQHVQDITVGYVPASSGIKLSAVSDFPNWIRDVQVNTSLKTVTFRVDPNQGEEARTGTVTLSATIGNECMIYPITVIQSGLGDVKIAVTPEQLSLPAKLSNTTEYIATIVAQSRYTSMVVAVGEGADWLTAEKVQGTNAAADAITEQVKVVAKENTGNNPRTATVVLTFKYGTRTIVKTFSVVQAGLGDPFITITNPTINLSYQSTGETDAERARDTIYYTRSSEHIRISDAIAYDNWIEKVEVSTTSNQIYFNVTENKGTDARTGTINVYATRDGVTLTYPVTIVQAGYGDVDIQISPKEVELAAAADMAAGTGEVTLDLTIVANQKKAVIKQVAGGNIDWLTIGDYDSIKKSCPVTAKPNTTYFDREAIITVTVQWGNQTVLREIKVKQAHWGGTAGLYTVAAGSDAIIDNKQIWVNPTTIGGTITFNPSLSGASVTITSIEGGDQWLTSDKATATLTNANTTGAPRSATVSVTSTYGTGGGTETITEVYTVTQEALALSGLISTTTPVTTLSWDQNNNSSVPTISYRGIDRQTVLLEAGDGDIIKSISDPGAPANIAITGNGDTLNKNSASFYYAAGINSAFEWNESTKRNEYVAITKIVTVTVASSHNQDWVRKYKITLQQVAHPGFPN